MSGTELRKTMISRRQPSARIIAAVVLSLAIAVVHGIGASSVGLIIALLLSLISGIFSRKTMLRLVGFNIFMMMMWLTVPFTYHGGESMGTFIPGLNVYTKGIYTAAVITLKGNAIILIISSLLSTLEPVEFGRGMETLHVPRKLTGLFLFTVGYINLLRKEFEKLHEAMRVRCFVPRSDVHTWKSYGYLAGMMIIRSFDRSERILEAMKCRGFDGEYRFFRRERPELTDLIFAVAASVIALLFLVLDRI